MICNTNFTRWFCNVVRICILLLFEHTNEKYFNGKNFSVCDWYVIYMCNGNYSQTISLDELWCAMWKAASLMVSFTLSNSIFKVAAHVSYFVYSEDVLLAYSLHTTHSKVATHVSHSEDVLLAYSLHTTHSSVASSLPAHNSQQCC